MQSDGDASLIAKSLTNFQTLIVVNGRIFVAANDQVYAFTVR